MMFDKILIANRGEVAVRIIRAAHELGVKTVVVYSEADADSLPVKLSDEAVCIGPAPSAKSYLVIQNIIGAAQITGAQAIHPGYGFLSESAEFARACADNDIVFIGPSPEAIEQLGDKAHAKATMTKLGVPTVPGSDGAVETAEEAARFAEEVGYPVLIKASAGGGGKGMRVAESADELEKMFTAAKTEAAVSFGNDEVYLEKYLSHPRHVEVQLLADTCGNAMHLCERDCSIQRRHQKLLEEAPSPALDEATRQAMGEAALKAVRGVGYVNAGTIEFLLDTDGRFYFMEMNTRIQVEHPVTEEVTGVDLVCEQLRVAAGEPLSFQQEDLTIRGHAIECRINAEDPSRNFAPCPGTLVSLHLPGGPGVRVDSAAYQGYKIPPFYDSMIGKLIVYGADREQAIVRMRRALAETLFEGVVTATDYQMHILCSKAFVEANFNVNSIANGDFD